LATIDESKLLVGRSIDKIAFQYKSVDYLVWSSEKIKSIKGKGNTVYRRLETFYAVSDADEKTRLHMNYNLIKINTILILLDKLGNE